MSAPPEANAEDLRAAEVLWDYHCIYEPPRQADAIVGLGSYDLRVADWCADLYESGFAPVILFTGAAGNWTAGLYAGSEAAAFRDRALERAVPRGAILLEERATNIGENLRFSSASLPFARTVILVTKPQTQRRVLATAERQWRKVEAIVTAPLHGFIDQPTPHHSMEDLICEMVGDVWRIKTYPTLGYQSEQPLPADVKDAFDYLVARGFTRHLPAGYEEDLPSG
ncbi:YdcF family protein [Oricola nitratireducens]|uniref:YdcF family protein n=1 Tax=Oricola nitratireducens TaxID=2775868 RepID=UPI00186906E2|nr:YdcF family protein [Oricola nitratireducens]